MLSLQQFECPFGEIDWSGEEGVLNRVALRGFHFYFETAQVVGVEAKRGF